MTFRHEGRLVTVGLRAARHHFRDRKYLSAADCPNSTEFRHRLKWLSEGILAYHIELQHGTTPDPAKVLQEMNEFDRFLEQCLR